MKRAITLHKTTCCGCVKEQDAVESLCRSCRLSVCIQESACITCAQYREDPCLCQVLCWCLCMLQRSCNILLRLMLPKDKGSGFYAMPSYCIPGRRRVSEASMWGEARSTFSWVITDKEVCFICSDALCIVPSAKSAKLTELVHVFKIHIFWACVTNWMMARILQHHTLFAQTVYVCSCIHSQSFQQARACNKMTGLQCAAIYLLQCFVVQNAGTVG